MAIGEWITIHEAGRRDVTPEKIIRQVEHAGFRLQRTVTFLRESNFLILFNQ
jgi:hypothetical protein